MTLIETLKKRRINTEDMDELIREAASDLATQAVNGGIEAQVTFLTDVCGFSEEDILRILEIE